MAASATRVELLTTRGAKGIGISRIGVRSAAAGTKRPMASARNNAVAAIAPPATVVLPTLRIEHQVALAGQRRVRRLLPAELEHVAAQVAGEVADDLLSLLLVDPDPLQRATPQAPLAVVGLDLHRAEVRAPQPERRGRFHLLRRRRLVALAILRLRIVRTRGGGTRRCGDCSEDHDHPRDSIHVEDMVEITDTGAEYRTDFSRHETIWELGT